MERFYITTAIDYPLRQPHMGHAFEKIAADIQARYRRMCGLAVYFTVGNDEHGTAVEQRARELDCLPQDYVSKKARLFASTWEYLDISHDSFVRTTSEQHHRGCRKFFQELLDADLLYEKEHHGMYCDGCEAFKTSDELHNGHCGYHSQREIIEVHERSYFFRLSRFKTALIDLYSSQPQLIQPPEYLGEVLEQLNDLEDIPVTRSGTDWGIPAPFDSRQRIYVWFDALLSYLTGAGYGGDEDLFRNSWPAEVHIIGKDILWFHAVLWPAMLIAAGLEHPGQIRVHGFLLINGHKMSKAMGNGIDPMMHAERFGVEGFRYLLFRCCGFNVDGNYDVTVMAEYYESEIKVLKKLHHDLLPLFQSHFCDKPTVCEEPDLGVAFSEPGLVAIIDEINQHMCAFEYDAALKSIASNFLLPTYSYYKDSDFTIPDRLDQQRTHQRMTVLLEALRALSIMLEPFMPNTCQRIREDFALNANALPYSYDPLFIERSSVQTS